MSNLLLFRESIDAADPREVTLRENYEELVQSLTNLSEKEIQALLQNQVSQSEAKAGKITGGLLYGILVDRNKTQVWFGYLIAITRDSFAQVIKEALYVIDKYPKLADISRKQLLWLLRELIRMAVKGTDTLMEALLRQIPGGAVTQASVWLCATCIDLLITSKSWLYQHSNLVLLVLYHFVRLIADHNNPNLTELRNKEITLCVEILQERPQDWPKLGRDFIRILSHVGKIPAFFVIWRKLRTPISTNEGSGVGSGGGRTLLSEMLAKPTEAVYLRCRLTPAMETQLLFLMQNVVMGRQQRYISLSLSLSLPLSHYIYIYI